MASFGEHESTFSCGHMVCSALDTLNLGSLGNMLMGISSEALRGDLGRHPWFETCYQVEVENKKGVKSSQ